jgi:hypothetical protein
MNWSKILTAALGQLPTLIKDAEALGVGGPAKKQHVLDAVTKLVGDSSTIIGTDHPLVQGALGVAVDALVNVQNLAAEIVASRPPVTAPTTAPAAGAAGGGTEQ